MENADEGRRLEEQSQQDAFDFKKELHQLRVNPRDTILDAGCGPGTVLRYLASQYPSNQFFGCDVGQDRVQLAISQAQDFKNIEFSQSDIRELKYPTSNFNQILCRYVLEHLSTVDRKKAVLELLRCLKPGGKLTVVDIDGFLFNLYPTTPVIDRFLENFQASNDVDVQIGRKLPFLLSEAGFENLSWEVQTVSFQGEALLAEMEMLKQRLDHAAPFLRKIAGSDKKYDQFTKEYFKILGQNGSVLFYNKFIVTGTKPLHLKLEKQKT